jgi:prepilin-type processing-associated H-X9-DG protein
MRPVRLSTAPAFTLVELLVLIVCIIILLMAIVPTADRSAEPEAAMCRSNLKQIGLALHTFAADHGERFPWEVPADEGGSMVSPVIGSPVPHFQALSNRVPSLTTWVCPTDPRKKPAADYAVFDDRNVSYFVSLDAAPTNARPHSFILAGDRHLEVAGKSVNPGLLNLTTNKPAGWTLELHGKSKRSPAGGMLFVDGHAEFVRSHGLMTVIRAQGIATNLVVVP